MYVVCGVSGNTGKAAAEALLAAGKKIRVVVRDSAKGEEWKKRGADVAVADLADSSALARAFAGAEGAYVLVPPQYAAEDLIAAQKPVIESIASAARTSGIPHVVLLSSIGAHLPDGNGPIRSLHGAERALRGAAKNLTILRAAYFLENVAPVLPEAVRGGVLPMFLSPGKPVPMVATEDIGRSAAEALLDPPRGVRIIELAGPKDLTPEDVAESVGRELGRKVAVQPLPLEAVEPAFRGAGMTAGISRLFREMYEGINAGRVSWEGGAASARRGRLGPGEVIGPILRAM